MTYFMRSVRRYSRYGIGAFCQLVADERPSRRQIRQALKTDIVYLAGGNTFYFLKALRKSESKAEKKKEKAERKKERRAEKAARKELRRQQKADLLVRAQRHKPTLSI